MNQPTDSNPTALAAVSAGVSYFLRNAGPETVYLEVASAAPADTDNAYPMPPGGDLYFSAEAGESVYAWSPRAVYDERQMNPLPPRACPCGRPTVTPYHQHCSVCIRNAAPLPRK